MPSIAELWDLLHDLPALVKLAGYIGLIAIIFVETGFFFGFCLPGDSLLVTAGLLIASGLDMNGDLRGAMLKSGRAHVWTPGTLESRLPSAACKKKNTYR